MNIAKLIIGNVKDEDAGEMRSELSDICTVGEFLEKYGKNYPAIDEEGLKKQLEYLDTVTI